MCLSPMTSSCGASDTLSLQPQHKASSQCRGWDRRLLQGKLRTGTRLSLACCIPTVDTQLYSEVGTSEKSGLLAEHLHPPASAWPWRGPQMFPLHLIISFYTCQGLTLRWVMLKLRFQLLSLCHSFLLMHESMSTCPLVATMWVQNCRYVQPAAHRLYTPPIHTTLSHLPLSLYSVFLFL